MPPSPAGWIITTARNRALDHLRREATRDARHAAAMQLLEQQPAEEFDVHDDRLRLIFTCCHPALAVEAQLALTLRLLGGLTAAEIAHAFPDS
jgi:RNA polymerase sigma-70 factor (ECF subfamily)